MKIPLAKGQIYGFTSSQALPIGKEKKSNFHNLGKNFGLWQGGEKPQESSPWIKDGITS